MRTDSNTVPPSIASTRIASTSIPSQADPAYSEAEMDSDFDTDDDVSDNIDERKMNIVLMEKKSHVILLIIIFIYIC